MGNFFRSLADPQTLVGLVFLSLLLNVVGVYLVRRFDWLLGLISKRWRRSSALRESELVARVERMLANPQLVLEARLILLEHYLLVVICLVMVVFGVLMLTPSFSWVLPIVFLLPLRVGSIVVLAFTLIFMLFSMLFFRRVAATRSVLARHEGMRLVKEWRVASSITPVGSSSEVKSKSG